jgi:hypothetical protein
MSRRDEYAEAIADAVRVLGERSRAHGTFPWGRAYADARDRIAALAPADPTPLSPRAQLWADAIVATVPGNMVGLAEMDRDSPRERTLAATVLAEAARDPEILAAINAAAERLRECSGG